MTTLDELETGQAVEIEAVTAAGEIGERLLEMGMTPGATVEIIRRAPFGDPVQVRLRGYLLAIRRAQARAVQVRRAPHQAPPARAGAA